MNQREKSLNSINYIIECAIDEFAKNGMDVSLNNICKNNGISKGKLYHHFSSKEELLCECVCYALDSLSNDIIDYEIDNCLSIQEIFHNYYNGRIQYWYENPTHLMILRITYALGRKEFSEETMDKIIDHMNNWRNTIKNKSLEIIHSKNDKLKTTDESFTDFMMLLYENTFNASQIKIVMAVINNDMKKADKISAELMNYYDTFISILLYGVFDN